MKNVLKLFAIILLFQSFQCEDDITERDKIAQYNALQQEKQNILNYIASVPCDGTSECNFIAIGSKPCGGPWEYIAYSNAIDITYLENRIAIYNTDEANYNDLYNIVSDCAVVNPPTNVTCINGVCTLIP